MNKYTLFDSPPHNLPKPPKKPTRMLTDAPRKPAKVKSTTYKPDSMKIEAVKLYLLSGNCSAVSAALGINRNTLHLWMNTNWWATLAEEIRTEGRVKLNQKLKKIAEVALDVTLDRLENGEYALGPKGLLIRKPVNARDAHRIANDLIQRHREDEEPIKKQTEAVEDRLAQLADAFSMFANKTHRVEIIDAVSETGRDQGLPERIGMGAEAPRTEETKSRENGSQESDGEGRESSSRGQSASGPHPTSESWRIELTRELESSPSQSQPA